MGKEALLEALEADVSAQCERIVSEAGEAAAAVVAEAEKAVREASAARMKDAALSLGKKRTAALLEARIRAEGVKLDARRGLIKDAIGRAVEDIRRMPGEDYARVLGGFIEEIKGEARRHGWKGSVLQLRVNPADVELVKGHGVEAVADPAVELGAVYISDDGRFRFENTVASRVKRSLDEIEALVNREFSRGGRGDGG